MSHNLVPSASNFSTTTVTVPDGGVDMRTAASLYPAFQRLTDNDAYIGANYLTRLGATFTLLGNTVIAPGTGPYKWTFSCELDATGGGVLSGGWAIDTAYIAGGQLTGSLAHVGVGRSLERTFFMTDANANKGINDATHIVALTGVFSVDRTLTLNTTGAVAGDRLYVTNHSTHIMFVTPVTSETGVAGATYNLAKSSGVNYGLDLVFTGTVWQVVRTHLAP